MTAIMATLREIMRFMCDCAAASGHSFSDEIAEQIEQQLRAQYGGDRVYIPPANSRKDPARGEAIRQAARTLPRGVVVARFGISRQLVAHHLKKGKNPAA
jgi:DNA-binding transcriptional regulator LsrR (DeoR family)